LKTPRFAFFAPATLMLRLNLQLRFFVLLSFPFAVTESRGQNADPNFLEQYAATYRFTLGQPTSIKITDDGSAVLFLRSGPRSFVRDLYEFDVATGKERLLVSAAQLLHGAEEELTAEEQARRERMRLAGSGIVSFSLSPDNEPILIPLSGSLYLVDLMTGKLRGLGA